MKRVNFTDIRNERFGIRKIAGFGRTSKGRLGTFIGKMFCDYNEEEGLFMPKLGRRETGKKVTVDFDDYFATPVDPSTLQKGDFILTQDGFGVFQSITGKIITMLTTDNEIVETGVNFDTYYKKAYVTKMVELYTPTKKLDKYENWDKKHLIKNEIMLEGLQIGKDNPLYDFLLNNMSPAVYAANCVAINPKFTNTLAEDIARPSMVVLVANGKVKDVVDYSLAAKIYGVSLDAFDGDREYFSKFKIPVVDQQLADYINKTLIEEFVGGPVEAEAAGEVEDEGGE